MFIPSSGITKYIGKIIPNGTKKTEASGEYKDTCKLIDSEFGLLIDEDEEIVVTLHDITMSLKTGTLLGVCGSVGSGKTSLIQAILGKVSTMHSNQIDLLLIL